MKKIFTLLLLASVILLCTGCSSTWDGVKSDTNEAWGKTKEGSNKAWNSTKEAIHNATE